MKHAVVRISMLCCVLGGLLACPSEADLGTKGRACDFDEQCQRPLVCLCVRLRNPDDEGPDEVIAHGRCEPTGTRCGSDAGLFEIGPDTQPPPDTFVADTGAAEVSADAGAEASDADEVAAPDASDDGG